MLNLPWDLVVTSIDKGGSPFCAAPIVPYKKHIPSHSFLKKPASPQNPPLQ